jgi:hypothetical protein
MHLLSETESQAMQAQNCWNQSLWACSQHSKENWQDVPDTDSGVRIARGGQNPRKPKNRVGSAARRTLLTFLNLTCSQASAASKAAWDKFVESVRKDVEWLVVPTTNFSPSTFSISLFGVAFLRWQVLQRPLKWCIVALNEAWSKFCRVNPKGCRVVSGASNRLQSERALL